jgi:hypothetical protein
VEKNGDAAQNAGHGGMDYVMMMDLFNAVRENKPVPLDCYDAAAWSAISPLGNNRSPTVGRWAVSHFTRGKWITVNQFRDGKLTENKYSASFRTISTRNKLKYEPIMHKNVYILHIFCTFVQIYI